MAFCITFGTHEFTSRLEGYENVRAYCYNCEHWDAYCITRWPWFTVCFVPVIPLSTHKYKEVTCARCHFTQDLSVRPDVQAQVQQQPPGAKVQGAQVQGALPGPSPAQQQSGPPGGGQVGHTYK